MRLSPFDSYPHLQVKLLFPFPVVLVSLVCRYISHTCWLLFNLVYVPLYVWDKINRHGCVCLSNTGDTPNTEYSSFHLHFLNFWEERSARPFSEQMKSSNMQGGNKGIKFATFDKQFKQSFYDVLISVYLFLTLLCFETHTRFVIYKNQ